MSDEETTEASQEEQDFSDDALDKAAEEFGESEESVEDAAEIEASSGEEDPGDPEEDLGGEEEEEVIPAEPSENSERSKLGRKVKYIEDTVINFQESFEEKMNRLEGLLVSSTRRQQVADEPYGLEDDPDEEVIGTKAELKQFLNDYNKETESTRQENQVKYERDYVQTIKRLGSEETEEDHKDIYDEMMSHFNVRHSNNPLVDAEKNYLKATRSVLKKKVAAPVEKKNPLKGNKPKAPLGAGGNNETMPKKIKPMPKFDAAAQDFMRKSGITPERAAEILDGDAPANLGRR